MLFSPRRRSFETDWIWDRSLPPESKVVWFHLERISHQKKHSSKNWKKVVKLEQDVWPGPWKTSRRDEERDGGGIEKRLCVGDGVRLKV